MTDSPGPLVSRMELVAAAENIAERLRDKATKFKDKAITANQLEWMAKTWELYADLIKIGKFR